jgi:hypothetical protein
MATWRILAIGALRTAGAKNIAAALHTTPATAARPAAGGTAEGCRSAGKRVGRLTTPTASGRGQRILDAPMESTETVLWITAVVIQKILPMISAVDNFAVVLQPDPELEAVPLGQVLVTPISPRACSIIKTVHHVLVRNVAVVQIFNPEMDVVVV